MNFIRYCCLFFLQLYIVFTAISFVGAFVPAIDIVNHFRPFVFIAGVAGLLIALLFGMLKHSSFTTLVFIVTIGMHAFFVVPPFAKQWLQFPGAQVSDLKIIQFNSWRNNIRHDRVVDFIKEEKPDVLVLNEIINPNVGLAARLKTLFKHEVNCGKRPICDIVILSNWPVENSRLAGSSRDTYPWLAPIVRADLSVPENKGGGSVSVFAVHTGHPLPVAVQQNQFGHLIDEVEQVQGQRMIISGDLNSTPWSFVFHSLRESLSHYGADHVTHAMMTWPTPVTRLGRFGSLMAIDHIFASSDLVPVSVRSGPVVGSDHRPVIAEFAIE